MNMSKEIQLTRGKVAIVDDEDYEWLNQWKWCYASSSNKIGYAGRSIKEIPNIRKAQTILMHSVIFKKHNENIDNKYVIDHIDGDTLNNQKCNLRLATRQQNQFNQRKTSNKKSSKYKGVSWFQREQKWCARIVCSNIKYGLGYYDDEIEAALAYNRAALKYFGKFAKLNQIEGELMC
jgi:hypothetical protein